MSKRITETYETPATIPHPDPPTEFTEDAVVSHVEEFERIYRNRAILCDQDRQDLRVEETRKLFGIGYSVDELVTVDRIRRLVDIVARLMINPSRGVSGDDLVWAADPPLFCRT